MHYQVVDMSCIDYLDEFFGHFLAAGIGQVVFGHEVGRLWRLDDSGDPADGDSLLATFAPSKQMKAQAPASSIISDPHFHDFKKLHAAFQAVFQWVITASFQTGGSKVS